MTDSHSNTQIKSTTADAYKLLHNGVLAFSRAEQQGIRVDVEYLHDKKLELDSDINDLLQYFYNTDFYKEWKQSRNYKEVNVNSNPQLSQFLYKVKEYTPQNYTEKGSPSTDESALKDLNVPALDTLVSVRKKRKLKDYLDLFDREQVNGYLHPFFNLHTARTYRSSCNSPNFQNIPKRDDEAMKITRDALYPRPGHQLLEVDYGSLEVSIAACYHQDPTMIEYIKNPDNDMHKDMAEQIFLLEVNKSDPKLKLLRSAAKNGFVFPQFYGDYHKNNALSLCKWVGLSTEKRWKKGEGVSISTNKTISTHLIEQGISSPDRFIKHLEKIEDDFWNKRFKVYQKWKDRWWRRYKRNGYIDTLTGFQCKGVMKKNDCINYPIQGAAFHCLLWSFIEIDKVMREESWNTRLIGQIHDAIILDVDPYELEHVTEIVKYITCKKLPETWKWIIVPLEVEAELCPVDAPWSQKEDYKI